MSGRIFSDRSIIAYIWDGEEKFVKHRARRDKNPENSDDENERLERYGDWLESGGNLKTSKSQETIQKSDKNEADNEEADKSLETGNEKADEDETDKSKN